MFFVRTFLPLVLLASVHAADTSIAITSTNFLPLSSVNTHQIDISITVLPVPGTQSDVGGTVTFSDGGTVISGSVTTVLTGNTASFNLDVSTWVTGEIHTITANYVGNLPNFKASVSQPIDFMKVEAGTESCTVAFDPDPTALITTYGETVTLTVRVTGDTDDPTGTVYLLENNLYLNNKVGVPVSSGIATFNLQMLSVNLAASPHTISAVYGGDAVVGFGTSTTSATVNVGKAETICTLSGTTPIDLAFPPIRYTVTVTRKIPATGTSAPSGKVTIFTNSTKALGPVLDLPVVNQALNSALPYGIWPMTASYSGDISYKSCTSNLFQQEVIQQAVYVGRSSLVTAANLVMVLYGPGRYLPEIKNNQMPGFYKNFVKSPSYTLLQQYSRGSEKILPGVYVGRYKLTTKAPALILESTVRAGLLAGIKAKLLPKPVFDIFGLAKTIYMVHFPKSVVIKSLGALSCSVWCGIHGTFPYKRNATATIPVPYFLIPDFSPGGTCFKRCGQSNSSFLNVMSTVSHEIIEAVTNPWSISKWYSGDEIADRCEGVDEQWTGSLDSAKYIVQRYWSNQKKKCVGNPSSTFTISVVGANVARTFTRGETLVYTIRTASYLTTPVLINFRVENLPAGWTATFSPAVVAAGNPVTLTVVSSTPAMTTWLTIVGATTTTNARSRVLLDVRNLKNGGFTTNLGYWVVKGKAVQAIVQDSPYAIVGSDAPVNSLSQTFLINANFVYLDVVVVCCNNDADCASFIINPFSTGAAVVKIVVAGVSAKIEIPCSTTGHHNAVTIPLSAYKGQNALLTLSTNNQASPHVRTLGLFGFIKNENTK